ncbi:MAG: hypothetical protein AAF633_06800 [Chloroflexota bacterium]
MKRSLWIVFTFTLLMITLSACGGDEISNQSSEVPVELESAVDVVTEVDAEDSMLEEEAPALTEAVVENEEAEAVVEVVEAEPTAAEVVVESAEEEPEEEVAEAQEEAALAVVDPTDYAMISNTGRAQFLNSYASW